jgi:hypothetical protein
VCRFEARRKPLAVSCTCLDAAPPPPYVYAATDYRPRGAREVDLCNRASSVDWLYLGGGVLADAGSIALDELVFQVSTAEGVRLVGPSLIGLSWGFTVSGGYLALPKCSPEFVRATPPEGGVRADWPMAVGITLLATATAPVIVGVETGTGSVTLPWSTTERSLRLVLAGAGGLIGALVPYLLPPKTWTAARELERIRAGATAHGGFVGYAISF